MHESAFDYFQFMPSRFFRKVTDWLAAQR